MSGNGAAFTASIDGVVPFIDKERIQWARAFPIRGSVSSRA
ncbi:MAG: hypothetical protein ACOZCE_01970 [Spirochaetota bacterium]